MAFLPGLQPVSTPGEIDYRLARRRVLAAWRGGTIARHDICDAHPELRRAGAEVGSKTNRLCPVCADEHPESRRTVVQVTYVFGPRLPAFGRCISKPGEIARLAERKGEHTAYEVEVCPECAWNHLVRAYLLGPGHSR